VLAGLGAGALLLFNTAVVRSSTDFRQEGLYRRLWDDLTVGIDRYLGAGSAAGQQGAEDEPRGFADRREMYRGLLIRGVRREEIRPWQFWRTLDRRPFQSSAGELKVPETADPGRALLLAGGFRLLGGVAPFLILWLGALAALPLLVWTAWDLAEAGFPLAGALFVVALSCSPFVVETLSLSRSEVGFHVLGLLVVAAQAAHGIAGAPASTRRLLGRALTAGTTLALLGLCRSGCLSMVPALGLALLLGARRRPPEAHPGTGPWQRGAAALLLLVLPFALVRQEQQHDTWQAIWEGLGDFDRAKGHYWADAKALEVLQANGISRLRSPAAEGVFRGIVLREMREDPLWYAGILGRRVLATVTQAKLRPWGPRDGISMAESDSPNAGAMDKYYRYTTTVDHVGLASLRLELPLLVLWLPTGLLAGAWLLARRREDAARAARLGRQLQVLCCVGLAALPAPVLISTAAAQETQAFALVYLLGGAFLLEEAARGWRARLRGGTAAAA
jgi:hypothetical protein